ncbi:MAG: alpha/beta hydrolase family protein, partial [Candidatus Hermodarchaeota archaeon]
ILLLFFFVVGSVIVLFKTNYYFRESESTINIQQTDDFDILEFWDSEIERVNTTPLNLYFGQNKSVNYINPYLSKTYLLNYREVYFDSPNWVGASPETLRIHGYILYPDEIKEINPGCLVMHGLNGDIKDVFDLMIPYLEKGFIVLAHSHPGHGMSEGAEPTPENLYYQGNYNQSAHFYLTLCAAIQGLRVLENLPLINKSQIFVTGASYGGLNAMWLSGICGDRIAGVVSYIAIGDISKNLDYPSKLIFWILGKNANEIGTSYLNNQLLRFDPIYYLKSPKVPPILWQIGTNDDFFHYSCIQGTFNAVPHNDKFLQIFPNEHHGFPFFENSTKFFIDYILNNGQAPPKINQAEISEKDGLIGTSLELTATINSTVDISSVRMIYNRIDIVGSCWEELYFKKLNNQTWKVVLTPGLFDSKVDYYIIVEVAGMDKEWFSSNIFSESKINSNYSAIFIIILLALISVPMIMAIRNKFLKLRYIEKELFIKTKKRLIISVISVFVSEVLAYLSLILPWIIYEKGGVIFTHIYFFNNIFTWKLFFGEFASILTSFFLVMLIFSILSFMKPVLTGIFKLIYPSLILVLICLMPLVSGELDPKSLASNFGITVPGAGPIFMMISAILTIMIGRRETMLYTTAGLQKVKKKPSLKNLRRRIKTIFINNLL